jgi:hypothetical protein
MSLRVTDRQRSEKLPPLPSYLSYPDSYEAPTYTFWDDHSHQIWPIIITLILAGCLYALFQSFTLCGCKAHEPVNGAPTAELG